MPGLKLAGFLMILLIPAESVVMLKQDDYEYENCTGRLMSTRYWDTTGCTPATRGLYRKWSCFGSNATVTIYTDSACTSVFDPATLWPVLDTATLWPDVTLDICDTRIGRNYSCSDITSVLSFTRYSSEDCDSSVEDTFNHVIGCHPSGYIDYHSGTMLRSGFVSLDSGGNIASLKAYNSSLDCTGPYEEVTLPCGGVCVKTSAPPKSFLNGTGLTYLGSCDATTSEAVSEAFTGFMSTLVLVAVSVLSLKK